MTSKLWFQQGATDPYKATIPEDSQDISDLITLIGTDDFIKRQLQIPQHSGTINLFRSNGTALDPGLTLNEFTNEDGYINDRNHPIIVRIRSSTVPNQDVPNDPDDNAAPPNKPVSLLDMPWFMRCEFLRTLKLWGPKKAATELVTRFWKCLGNDLYPEREEERIFGIEMLEPKTPEDVKDWGIGKLTYEAWTALFRNRFISQDDVVKAFLAGNLPRIFEEKVTQNYQEFLRVGHIPNEEGCFPYYMNQQVVELIKRGFSGISWDSEIHEVLRLKPPALLKVPTQKVKGLKIDGDEIQLHEFRMDTDFENCPIAAAAGIPLMVKRLPTPGKKANNYIIVRMMSDPVTGLAPLEWTYGGMLPAAPPVLVGRSDSVPFTREDWYVLDDFEMVMLDDGPRTVTRDHFIKFAKSYHGPKYSSVLLLEAIYPKGSQVRITGIQSRPQLNNMIAQTNGDYQNGRIGVRFNDNSILALKECNLTHLK